MPHLNKSIEMMYKNLTVWAMIFIATAASAIHAASNMESTENAASSTHRSAAVSRDIISAIELTPLPTVFTAALPVEHVPAPLQPIARIPLPTVFSMALLTVDTRVTQALGPRPTGLVPLPTVFSHREG